ncbi:hypothetical protein D9M70_465250 [compost metagenome]
MISDETGSSWKVIGSSMAMVAVAPMPGSTPIKVPSKTPIRQKSRLAGEAAVAKPSARLLKSSIARLLKLDPGAEALEGQAEAIAEHRDREGGQRQ